MRRPSRSARCLTPGTLVSYETTLPSAPRAPAGSRCLEEASGLTEGVDFDLVFSPERVLTGRVFADLRKYPKLVGGLSEHGAAKAVEFYKEVLDFDERADLPRPNGVWDLGSAEAAELAKLAETTYRDVNIGLANQFARYAATAGIDVYQVIEASNSQPYSHIHPPGIAVGGHCIPVYPRALPVDGSRGDDRVCSTCRQRGDARLHDAALLEGAYGDLAGAKVVVAECRLSRRGSEETAPLGSVRRRVEDSCGSGARPRSYTTRCTRMRSRAGARVHAVPPRRARRMLRWCRADHAEYRALGPADLPGIRAFIDGRRVSSEAQWLGIPYRVIGRSFAA